MTPELVEAVARIARYCWRDVHWVKRPGGPVCIKTPLTKGMLQRHCDAGPAVGLAPITPGTDVTSIALIDLDDHEKKLPWQLMAAHARNISERLRGEGMVPIPFRSSGGHGIHLIMLWAEPQDAYSVRTLIAAVLQEGGIAVGTKGVDQHQAEVFPKQDRVEADGFGSMFILPMSGESLMLDDVSFEPLPHEMVEDMREWPVSTSVPVQERPVQAPPALALTEHAPEFEQLRVALAAVPNSDLPYDEWRDVVFAIHHATGGSEDGRALAHLWSSTSAKYDAEFLDERVWPYVRDEREGPVITAQHIFTLAHAHDWDDDIVNEFPALGEAPDAATEAHSTGEESVGARPRPPSTGTAPSSFPVRFPGRSIPAHIEVTKNTEWIIDDVLPRHEVALIAGAWGSGKSFLALDMAGAVARGERWYGYPTQRTRVALVLAEGGAGQACGCGPTASTTAWTRRAWTSWSSHTGRT